ncbi:MAG: lysophospholipase [Oscillospiraceae bacterium]|nr:lysophospholipase [Oscillospiraceae bacterium]
MKQTFYYPSQDGKTRIHAMVWLPEGKPRAVLQICHGMCEYIGRYDEFARFLNANGFVVVGNDHLGHGASVVSEDMHGYFAKENGNFCLLKDVHRLRRIIEQRFPGLPYFWLGHSMGSFLTRQYLAYCGKGLAGAVIMGTGSQPALSLYTVKWICRRLASVHGWKYCSRLVDFLTFGNYSARLQPARTLNDWLTKEEAIVDAYIRDPWCTFRFSLNAYYNMFSSIEDAQNPETVAHIPKHLPMLLVSGAEDPVGQYGAGVKQAYRSYLHAGLRNVEMKLYPGDRHEILNETDREVVYVDLLDWLHLYLPEE